MIKGFRQSGGRVYHGGHGEHGGGKRREEGGWKMEDSGMEVVRD